MTATIEAPAIAGAVAAQDLAHSYGDRPALNGVSFSVADGETFGVLGPNGSGKSTLFRILSTLMKPARGQATIAGCDVAANPAEVRRRIGVVFQSQSLDRKLTVRENLEAQGYLHGLSGATLRGRIAEVLARLGIADRTGDIAGTLSGGLKRRVEIAKALLHTPRVLLMDEPSTGLDPIARRDLWQFVSEQRVTVVLTTHLLDEADRCDRLMLLHKGMKVAEGSPAELKSRLSGDVVILDCADPYAMKMMLGLKFKVQVKELAGAVRVEVPNGHRFIAEVIEAAQGAITSVTLHKPTLEDVFLECTGTQL